MRTTFSAISIGDVENTKKKKNAGSGIIKVAFGLIGLALIGFFCFALVNGFRESFDKGKWEIVNIMSKTVGDEMKKDQYGNVNALLLGYGGAGHDGGFLTDSIIVASRNPTLGTLSMFSIPRDLWVKYPSGGYGRINAAFYLWLKHTDDNWDEALSGERKEIGNMLGLDIPYYATIDFTAFKDIVDIVGGIDIVVPETLHDTSYPNDANRGYITFHMDAGPQHLDGATALKYARSRHSTSDFARSLRQQQIIQGIKEKLLGSGLNVSTVGELYNFYTQYIKTNVSAQEMLWATQFIKNLGSFASLGFTTNCGFQSIIRMVPACFLYTPSRDYFDGASVILPMDATVNKVQHYDQMQKFTQFVVSNSKAVQDKVSIEVVSAIDSTLAKENRMGSVKFADQMGVKMKRYGLNVVETMIWADPSPFTKVVVRNLGDYTSTIEAIRTFLPEFKLEYYTGDIQYGWDEDGNETVFVNGADLQVILGNDYLLGTNMMSGVVDKKFSYEL